MRNANCCCDFGEAKLAMARSTELCFCLLKFSLKKKKTIRGIMKINYINA